jgi:hypothetical protein
MAMTAREAYGSFMRQFLDHLSARASQDATLARLQLPREPCGPRDNILVFTVPGGRKIRLAFRQSRIVQQAAGQRKALWKVLALEIGLGNGLNRQTIEACDASPLPIGWRDTDEDNELGEFFFIELPWGQGNSQEEHDRLVNQQVQDRLFDFADDAIRFALSAINGGNEGRAGSRR